MEFGIGDRDFEVMFSCILQTMGVYILALFSHGHGPFVVLVVTGSYLGFYDSYMASPATATSSDISMTVAATPYTATPSGRDDEVSIGLPIGGKVG